MIWISAIHNLNSQGNLVSDGSAILVMKSRIPKLRVRLGSAFCASQTFAFLPFFFFFYSRKVWLFNPFSATCGSHALFTDPQISLFSIFFIKNGSHGTIYTFKNYFATVFFSFQFSAVSKRTLKYNEGGSEIILILRSYKIASII